MAARAPRRRRNLGHSAYWRRDRGCWYWSLSLPEGRRCGAMTDLRDRERDGGEATRRAAMVWADAQRGSGRAASPPCVVPTLAQLLAHDAARATIAEATRQMHVEQSRVLVARLGAARSVDTITAADLDRYVVARRGEGVASRTIQMELGVLRGAWRRAHEDRLAPAPPRMPRVPGDRYAPTCLSREQLGALFRAAAAHDAAHPRRGGNPRMAHLLVMLANTALRRSELLRMTWRDVGEDAIEIATRKRGRAGDYYRRRVPINAAVREVLEARRAELAERPDAAERLAPEAAVWAWAGRRAEPHRPIGGRVYRELREIARAAGIEQRVRLHDLRHSAATLLYHGGLSVVDLARLLGHSTPTTTLAIYAHTQAGRAAAALDAIGLPPPGGGEGGGPGRDPSGGAA